MMSDETYSTEGPSCPYCGYLQPDQEYFYSDNYTEQKCCSCGKTFRVEVRIKHSWTCKKKEE